MAKIVYACERHLLPDDVAEYWAGERVEQWRNLTGFCLVETVSSQKVFVPHALAQDCFTLSGWFELYGLDGRIFLIDSE